MAFDIAVGSLPQPATFDIVIGNAAAAAETPVASLGGIMTIALLAQQGARRDRQIVYGPKWPMLRRRK